MHNVPGMGSRCCIHLRIILHIVQREFGIITIQNNSGLNTALDLRSDGLTLFINDINYLVYRVFAMIIRLYLHFNHMNSLLKVL